MGNLEKYIIAVVLVVAVGYFNYKKSDVNPVQPLYAESYVVVYGRDVCGNTRHMEEVLSRAGVEYYSGSIDDMSVKRELFSRMRQAGYDTKDGFSLPIVDVNGEIMINPNPQKVMQRFHGNNE